MPNRLIKSSARDSSLQLAACLSSLFAVELLAPSPELYLISPWISNMPLLPNRFGQFRALMPDLSRSALTLADLLSTLAERGVQVRIMCRPNQTQTEDFLRRLSPSISMRKADTLHEKGLVSAQFYLRGSMNFTYSGVNLNDETIELTTDPEEVARALLEARRRWEGMEPAC